MYFDGVRALRQNVLDETAGGDQHVMRMAEVEEFAHGLAWHQAE